MLSEKKGCILNISSVWGEVGSSCESLYSATKGAVNALTKSLALELAPSNIKVNALSPGVVETDMLNSFNEIDRKYIIESIPLEYISTPMEVANIVEFLISDKNSYMTGQIINFDGGMST